MWGPNVFAFSERAATSSGSGQGSHEGLMRQVPARARNRLLALTFVLCALGFVLVGSFPWTFHSKVSTDLYLVCHTVFEFMSIVVSFAVFTVGWYGYKQNANKQDLVIGVVFATVGIIDFVHTLSYPAMPAFLSPNTTSKACTYWIAARLTDAGGLFAAAFVVANSRRRWLRPSILAVGALVFTSALVVVVSRFPSVLPPMFIPNTGLTPLKIHLEWTVIALYAGAIYVFGRRDRGEANVVLLQLALMVAIFSEFSFTLYRTAFDTYNLLGHVYKVAAYYLIFRALFLSSFQKPYHELVKARDQIEHSFSRIGTALASSLDLREVLQLIGELASDMLGSKHAAVMLIRNGELHIEAGRGIPEQPVKVPIRHSVAGMAVSTKKAMVVTDVARIRNHDPKCHCQRLDGPPARSIVSVPITSGEDVLGVLEVYSPEVGSFGSREADLLSSFARQGAVAIRNSVAYSREHQVAETLQRSLLPPAPTVPGLDIAVRYLPAGDVARVGGDLYDVFPLENGKVAVVIGDVCGHGLEAASLMAMTEHMLRALLIHGMSPGEAFQLTNRALARHSADVNADVNFVTVFVGVLDPRKLMLDYANAGHHLPVVLTHGACQPMELTSDLPLGVDKSTEYHTWQADLSHGTGLLLYTDGLVEVRKEGKMFGEDNLHRLCSELAGSSAESILDRLLERCRAWSAGILNDDIALVAVKWADQ